MRILIAAVAAMIFASAAFAHWQPGLHNTLHAINWAFCGHSHKTCALGQEAIGVSRCETGGTFSPTAENGQYKGLFQMGTSERATWGFGNNAWTQAEAAHRMYIWTSEHESGEPWHRWQCKPDGSLRW